jgi:hypothetical protein
MDGGVPLASSRGSSNAADVVDLAAVMAAFQGMNRCRIVITLTAEEKGGSADIRLGAAALADGQEGMEVTTLASANALCLANRHQTTDQAILSLLYKLDFQLASDEFAGKDKPL